MIKITALLIQKIGIKQWLGEVANVNISHIGDPLSGNDAIGGVINVESIPEKDVFDQHGNGSYNTELIFIFKILEQNNNISNLLNEIKAGYKNYDNIRTNGDKSTVTEGK